MGHETWPQKESESKQESEKKEEEEKGWRRRSSLWFPKFCACGNIGMYFICCYILQVQSVTEKEMPKGMKLKTKWFGEEKGNKMNVSLGGR